MAMAAVAVGLVWTAAQPMPSTRHAAPTRGIVVQTPAFNPTERAMLHAIATQTAGLPTVYAVVKKQATETAGHELATWAASPHGNPRLGN
jgi:hypothetical protein